VVTSHATRRETEKLEALTAELAALEQQQAADTLLLPRAQSDEAELRKVDEAAQQAWAKAHIRWIHGSGDSLRMDCFNRILPTGGDDDERYREAELLKGAWQRVSSEHQETLQVMHAIDFRLSQRRPMIAYTRSLIERAPGAQPVTQAETAKPSTSERLKAELRKIQRSLEVR
jgi:hypothetical protein